MSIDWDHIIQKTLNKRVFSSARFIVNKRSHLSPETVNIFVCLSNWVKNTQQGCICQIFTGGSEFRLATSDYSGHEGYQIGTVELFVKLDHVGLYRGVSSI